MSNQNNHCDPDNYLTIEALQDGLTASLSVNSCEYCIDGDGNWKTLTADTATESINTGQTLSFRGNLIPTSNTGIGTFTISKECNLKGNCMSMLFGDNAADNYSLSGKDYAFYKLFYLCTTLKSVSANFLPATTLANYCYQCMFNFCTSLTNTPKLPATTLKGECYSFMFQECNSLITASEISATTLSYRCCVSMFYGCKLLTVAPELLATTLSNGCYTAMFHGCTKLNYIKMLATDISASSCLNGWVNGVASSGTFVKNPNATWDVVGESGVPSGWTIVNAEADND